MQPKEIEKLINKAVKDYGESSFNNRPNEVMDIEGITESLNTMTAEEAMISMKKGRNLC